MIDDNEIKAGKVGGIEAVVKAINTHIDNADVCKRGCRVLVSMSAKRNKTKQKKYNKH